MGEAVTVQWSMHETYNEENVIARDKTAIMPSWADCEGNAESVVNDICEDFFTDALWLEFAGDDIGDGLDVVVRVTAPPSIAGDYQVGLDRPIKARAHRMPVATS